MLVNENTKASFMDFIYFESKDILIMYATIVPIIHKMTDDIMIDVFISYVVLYLSSVLDDYDIS